MILQLTPEETLMFIEIGLRRVNRLGVNDRVEVTLRRQTRPKERIFAQIEIKQNEEK